MKDQFIDTLQKFIVREPKVKEIALLLKREGISLNYKNMYQKLSKGMDYQVKKIGLLEEIKKDMVLLCIEFKNGSWVEIIILSSLKPSNTEIIF